MRSLAKYRKISVALMLLALLQCGGLHWFGLYTAAKALQSFKTARSQGMMAAIQGIPKVSGTCGMCRKIHMAKTQENAQQPHRQPQQKTESQQVQGLNFVIDARGFIPFIQVRHSDRMSPLVSPWQVRGETPPTPPPRLA